ncbi:MAG TPA: Fe-S cluster assembly protein SufD [Rhizomicrobium sp.]|jgi:Fe-S cluster assembly protein SufD|nr:Fe-S cluster assembly protein SufD [Rhizomicrobium sp.]
MSAARNALPESFVPEPGNLSPQSAWLSERRARAFQAFQAGGIPHRRVEEWKYSDLRNALEVGRVAANETVVLPSRDPFAAIAGPRLIMRDGKYETPAASMPDNFDIVDLASLGDDTPDWIRQSLGGVLTSSLGQASLALMQGGVAIRVRRGTEARLHLRFLQQVETVHSRVLIGVEEGASLILLESQAGMRGVTNLGLEVRLQQNARMTHVRLAEAAPDAVIVEEIAVAVARGAHYRAHLPQTGAKLSRLELAVILEGEGAEAALDGAGVLGGKLHADVTTHVAHAAGKTTSRQLFKYIAGGHSRAVYQGRISVHKGADGSDSRQTAKAILAGERAEADLKPELEIFADDVKCAHGAAVGDLDADSLFYLRARGIPQSEAREMLVRGFLEEAVAEIASEEIRAIVWNLVANCLPEALDEVA